MRAKKKGDSTDALDRATQGNKENAEADDFKAKAKQAADFLKALMSLEDDEEAEDVSPFFDEVDEDREAANESEIAKLEKQPLTLHITASDIRKGVLALEKVRSALTVSP